MGKTVFLTQFSSVHFKYIWVFLGFFFYLNNQSTYEEE